MFRVGQRVKRVEGKSSLLVVGNIYTISWVSANGCDLKLKGFSDKSIWFADYFVPYQPEENIKKILEYYEMQELRQEDRA